MTRFAATTATTRAGVPRGLINAEIQTFGSMTTRGSLSAQPARRLARAARAAIRLLREPGLEQDYAAAWEEWESSGEQAAWEQAAADGLADAAR